jgi:lysophospholipase L1-like esterase
MAIRKYWWAALLGLAGIVVLVVLAFEPWAETSDPAPSDPNPDSSFRIVALGDSFISGEGAQEYLPGTNDPRSNMCHRAETAYPYLLAEQFDASLEFVACSGARTWHVTGLNADGTSAKGQYPDSPEVVHGSRPQVEVEAAEEDPDAVLISIGGNDAGFSEIGSSCATPFLRDCRASASRWLRRLEEEVYPALRRTFVAVREAARGAPVFAMTYPNPLGPTYCKDLLGVNPAEWNFIRDVFVGQLNATVAAAAEAAGIRIIDLTGALKEYRFCEKELGETGINFIQVGLGSGVPFDLRRPIGLVQGSMHPNPWGHRLMRRVVGRDLEALRAGTLPPAPVPDPDRPSPHFTPPEIDLPAPQRLFPAGTECRGDRVSSFSQMSAEPRQRQFPVSAARPGSTACFRTYQAEWESMRVGADGKVRIPIDVSRTGVGSINEILVEAANGEWTQIAISRLSEGEDAP